jgi:DNA transformation protein
MPSSPDFVAHVLDLLEPVGPVTARAMFGGHGIYARGVMFALLDDDELFLKADDASRPRFEAAGCRQWTYSGPKGPVAGGYFRPPDEAHEDPEEMRPWAEEALAAALRKAGGPGRRRAGAGRRPATRRAGPKAEPSPRSGRGPRGRGVRRR